MESKPLDHEEAPRNNFLRGTFRELFSWYLQFIVVFSANNKGSVATEEGARETGFKTCFAPTGCVTLGKLQLTHFLSLFHIPGS